MARPRASLTHRHPAQVRRTAKTLGPPQVQDLPLHRRPGPVRAAVRPAGPVDHPRRAQLPVPIGPAFRRGWADLKPLSGSTQRPPVVHDPLSKPQTAAFGQGCVSVGHEDLQVTVCVFSSSTLTRSLQPLWISTVVSLSPTSVGSTARARATSTEVQSRRVGRRLAYGPRLRDSGRV